MQHQCQRTTKPPSTYALSYSGNAGGQCTRPATYTDGQSYYCTQHAKEPATITAKASGKIRPGLKRIEKV